MGLADQTSIQVAQLKPTEMIPVKSHSTFDENIVAINSV